MRRLINVLSAAVILALTAGLLLAAIPKIRDAATRAQCRNNLKQIGLALHNRYDTYGSFPPASVPNDKLSCGKRLSWLVDIVPFVEQTNIVIDKTKAWDEGENRIPMVRPPWDEPHERRQPEPLGEFKPFRCSSNSARAPLDAPGLTDYVGISGVGPDAAELALGYPGVGFFGCDRRLKREDVKDGLGSTIAAMETNRSNGPWTASGPPTVRGLHPSRSYLDVSGQFSSGHRSGGRWFSPATNVVTNVLFADGSVRELSDTISPQVLESMATIAGGEEVGRGGDDGFP